jgi:hypothetical protein
MGHAGDGVLMVSLGTGEQGSSLDFEEAGEWGAVEWAPHLIGMVLDGSNVSVDYQLRQILQKDAPPEAYFRFQVTLDAATGGIDDAGAANLKHLTDLTQAYLSRPEIQAALTDLCAQLTA